MQTLLPDSNSRRRLAAVILILSAAFAAAYAFGLLDPERFLEGLDGETLAERIRLIFALLFLPLLAGGLYSIRLGRRILESEQFPPPGTKVVRKAQVRKGKAAKRYGYGAVLYGLLLIAVSVYGAIVLPEKILDLVRDGSQNDNAKTEKETALWKSLPSDG